MNYAKVRADVAEFCKYYANWLGAPLVERLKAEVYEILEQAITWWGQQEIMNGMKKVTHMDTQRFKVLVEKHKH